MDNPEIYDALEPIAIIGMVGRFPGAGNIDEFWQNLCEGVESVSFFTKDEAIASGADPAMVNNPLYVRAGAMLEDIEMFDALFFGFSPREAELTDPQHRLFLECSWQLLEKAGYNPDTYKGQISVYAGVGMNYYLMSSLISNPDLIRSADYHQLSIGNNKDFVPTRVSYKLNLKGPSVNVNTACSSSLVAVHLACQNLLNYQCDMAMAGGVTIAVPQKIGYLYQEGGIPSPDGHCRAFDTRGQGTVPGSGVGIVLLKRLEDALADGDCIHAVIKGSSINNDGSQKVSYTAPSIDGQAEVISEAIFMAGTDSETITYVEAHGTGTTLGDPIEIAALTQAFRAAKNQQHEIVKKEYCAIGSVKTNIGHIDTASGVASLIKTALALKHKIIPPSLHFEQPNPDIDFENSPFYVNTKLSEWKTEGVPRRAGVSSFGIGGTNAHVVLEEFEDGTLKQELPSPGNLQVAAGSQLLLLSAKTGSALDKMTNNLADHLKQNPDLDIADVAHTLQIGRKTFTHRRMLICQDAGDAEKALHSLDPKRVFTGVHETSEMSVVFMFSGQGAQYVNMGQELYLAEPVFRKYVDQCAEILKPVMGIDLREVIYPPETDRQDIETLGQRLNRTIFTQPALFMIEYALAKLWETWGIRPAAMIGHSIGEYVAACLAGVFSLEDALFLVASRGMMMQEITAGSMLAVSLPEKDIQTLLDKETEKIGSQQPAVLSLAAVNAPSMCVISGQTGAVEALEKELSLQGIACRHLHTSHAFHSEMMDSVTEPFAECVKKITLRPPQIPYISNLTGKEISGADLADPKYWIRQLRGTVRFADGIKQLLKESNRVLLEVGPGQTLSTLAMQQTDKKSGHVVLASMRHPKDSQSDTVFILNTLGRLWLAGVSNPDWSSFHMHEQRRRIPLPTYPFERRPYWLETGKPKPENQEQVSDSELQVSKKSDIADWFYVPSWKRSPLPVSDFQFPDSGCWLVFLDECGLGSGIVKELEQKGQDVIIVKAGTEFAGSDRAYTINPGQPDNYDALISELHALDKYPKTIVHLWNVTSSEHTGLKPEWLDESNDLFFYSLLYLVQSLGRQGLGGELQISVISNGIHQVTGEESLRPEKATVLGPVKVIPLEYPSFGCRNIDMVIPKSGIVKDGKLVRQVLEEVMIKSSDPVIAWREDQRWIQAFKPIRLEKPKNKIASLLKERGTYLIPGGLGGIGFVLAEHLAKTVRAKLVLTRRSAFPIRDEWEKWLADHDEQDSISRNIRKLQEMENLGAEVMVFSADVADLEQMRKVISRTEERFGKIYGVIHSAGLVDYEGVIQKRTKAMTEGILKPKVMGTLVLDSLLKDVRPDFLMLCSSGGNILYKEKFGQVGYNAANEFFDAFACYKSMRDDMFTVSVNWEDWQEVGISAEAVRRLAKTMNIPESQSEDFLSHGLLPVEGTEVFNRVLESKKPRIAVSTRDLNFLIEHHDVLAANFLQDTVKAASPPPVSKQAANSGRQPIIRKKTDISDWFYLPCWKRSAPPNLLVQTNWKSRQTVWLVFLDKCCLGSQLMKRLEEEGQTVVTVKAGPEFAKSSDTAYILNPGQSEDYNLLFSELRSLDKLPENIIHLWSVTSNTSHISHLTSHLTNGFYSLLFLARAIGNLMLADTFRITVVSDNMQEVIGEKVLCPEKATILGPVKIIPQEYPNIRCRSIDVVIPKSGSELYPELADWLLAELAVKSPDPVIARRENLRWVQTFEPIRLEKQNSQPPGRLRQKGVYLITGGLGNVGLVLAKYLAKTVTAKLILTGRSIFPARNEWEEWLTANDDQDSTTRKIRKLMEIEDLGSEILTTCADVANEEQMQKMVAQAKARFGAINGVIHGAGIIDEKSYNTIQEADEINCEQHFYPKIHGLFILGKVLQDEPDFCLLLSSLSSVLGGIGTVAYSAANLFMDAFAYRHNQENNTSSWISVNWERWQDAEKKEQNFAALSVLAEYAISQQEGADIFHRVLSAWPYPQVIVSSGDLEARIDPGQIESEFLSEAELAHQETSFGYHARPDLPNVYVAPGNEIEQAIADKWQTALGIEQVGIHDNFFDMGGNSLIAIQLMSWLRETFQVVLSHDAIFNASTVAEIARKIEEKGLSAQDFDKNTRKLQSIEQDAASISGHSKAEQSISEQSISEQSGNFSQKILLKKEYLIDSDTPLICIQPHGEKRPIFLIHPAGGSVFCYTELARQFDMDRPVYALQAFGFGSDTPPLTSIEDMATRYIEAIRLLFPKGPYILGGLSAGGNIACEMAQQFRQQGEDVPLLIVIDTFARYTPFKDDIQYFLAFSVGLGGFLNVDILRLYSEIRGLDPKKGIEEVQKDLQLLSYKERLNVLWECIQKSRIIVSDVSIEYLEHFLMVFSEICRSLFSYIPQTYPGRIILFRAVPDDNMIIYHPEGPIIQQKNDRTLGWDAYASGFFEAHDISGANHYTITAQPHAKILVEKLKYCMEELKY